MSAFFIATVTVKDGNKFAEYGMKSKQTFAPYHGEIVSRGKFEVTLCGAAAFNAAAVVKFPTMADLQAWYDSDAYQALIPLRDEAADITITAYEQPEG